MADTITALVQRNKGKSLVQEQIPKPKPGAHQLLVKISHVAQNPTDVQALDSNALGDGAVLGCDFVGTVEEIGDKVTKKATGDVVAGLIWGGEIHGLGAYSEATLADESISFKIPSSVSRAEAATVPLAAATAQLALFSENCLNLDRNSAKNTPVLIWGGSSSVGLYALQLLRLNSFSPIITTCSPHNNSLVQSAGAHIIHDHSAEHIDDTIAEIRRQAPNLRYVFDTIGSVESSSIASRALSDEGGTLVTVRPGKANTGGVKTGTDVRDVLVWTAFEREVRYGEFVWPPNKKDHDLVAEFFEKMPAYLEDGSIKPSRVKSKKGLEAVEEGFKEHREGKISGYKIVYSI